MRYGVRMKVTENKQELTKRPNSVLKLKAMLVKAPGTPGEVRYRHYRPND